MSRYKIAWLYYAGPDEDKETVLETLPNAEMTAFLGKSKEYECHIHLEAENRHDLDRQVKKLADRFDFQCFCITDPSTGKIVYTEEDF